ncbi:hypothetical protein PIB30_028134 [Stylosanthes scabra]|uniref:Uncharacterized protein n=1 Tax=Stylosanthes scabra TaxID=79078 RepID=A0ABU6VD12_9FABA|nr:hypothetical protein [Stylosanthes scabra]
MAMQGKVCNVEQIRIVDTSTSIPCDGPSNLGHDRGNATIAEPIQFAAPPERIGDESESDEDYVADTDEGNCGSSEDEYVAGTSIDQRFLLPAPLPDPDISTVHIHFHMLDLDTMEGKQ